MNTFPRLNFDWSAKIAFKEEVHFFIIMKVQPPNNIKTSIIEIMESDTLYFENDFNFFRIKLKTTGSPNIINSSTVLFKDLPKKMTNDQLCEHLSNFSVSLAVALTYKDQNMKGFAENQLKLVRQIADKKRFNLEKLFGKAMLVQVHEDGNQIDFIGKRMKEILNLSDKIFVPTLGKRIDGDVLVNGTTSTACLANNKNYKKAKLDTCFSEEPKPPKALKRRGTITTLLSILEREKETPQQHSTKSIRGFSIKQRGKKFDSDSEDAGFGGNYCVNGASYLHRGDAADGTFFYHK